jgi:hypothetical protein
VVPGWQGPVVERRQAAATDPTMASGHRRPRGIEGARESRGDREQRPSIFQIGGAGAVSTVPSAGCACCTSSPRRAWRCGRSSRLVAEDAVVVDFFAGSGTAGMRSCGSIIRTVTGDERSSSRTTRSRQTSRWSSGAGPSQRGAMASAPAPPLIFVFQGDGQCPAILERPHHVVIDPQGQLLQVGQVLEDARAAPFRGCDKSQLTADFAE